MKGTRIQPGEDGGFWLEEGQYIKTPRGWLARPPGYHGVANLNGHEGVEHEDGTISVSPSIRIWDSRSEWHGWLEKGVWRKA